MKKQQYKTSLNGLLISGTYQEIVNYIANSGLMSMHAITKI